MFLCFVDLVEIGGQARHTIRQADFPIRKVAQYLMVTLK